MAISSLHLLKQYSNDNNNKKMNISKFYNLYNKKILITGATGIVGFNLCKELKKIPCEIHINYLNNLDSDYMTMISASGVFIGASLFDK